MIARCKSSLPSHPVMVGCAARRFRGAGRNFDAWLPSRRSLSMSIRSLHLSSPFPNVFTSRADAPPTFPLNQWWHNTISALFRWDAVLIQSQKKIQSAFTVKHRVDLSESPR
ncbi:hypothetical protein JAAARDRAFT_587197 [Jaapia argillacea MUCL 33604]|uniref:Uncharacterized protein n=1 Tax=Jaapia argillacea MUCL 33604 TaxID=933084 RepID=A0A067P989_9AGAM|nr:hypothetical protein JAAARDRAFT_587197 [Jaapia argillacea MUCL 33604]